MIAAFALPTGAMAGGEWCTAPFVQVAGPGSGVEPTGEFVIQSISMGEPLGNCSGRFLTIVIKVNTLDPGNTGQVTPPADTEWEVEFNVPHSLLTPDPGVDQKVFVSWDTKTVPTGQFNYGFLDTNVTTVGPFQTGESYTGECSLTSSTCAATGTVTPDGTITINLDLSSPLSFRDINGNLRFTMADLPPGWQLSFIAGNTWTCACAAGDGTPVNVSMTKASQNYTVRGNGSCSDPPIAAVNVSATSGDAPFTVTFDASGSTIAPGGCGTIKSYTFDFGDGKKSIQSTPTVSHTYKNGGTYIARVKVTNSLDATSTNNAEVDIAVNSTGPPLTNPAAVRDDFYIANGQVYAMATVGDTLYIGGAFTQVGPVTGSAVPIDSTSGSPVTGFPKVDGVVSAVASDGSGGWFIGGQFSLVGGIPRSNIAHILADNSVAAWNPSANDAVDALAVSGSTVYAGGVFTNIGGQTRNNIAALDSTTGLSTSWNPNANATVYSLAISGSTIYAGGAFSNIGGQSRNRIAALDATTANASPWNPNANNTVFALTVNDLAVYAGGDFTNIGGQLRNHIAAIDPSSGQASLVWNPNASSTVLALASSDSAVYAGGAFITIGGQQRNHIAEIDVGTGLAVPFWNPNTNGDVLTLALSGTTIYLGGRFTNVGGQIRDYIAALDATGAATAWNPSTNNPVNALALSGSTIYAGGSFTSVGGQGRNNLAAFDTVTGLPTIWNPGASGTVFAMAADSSAIYVGGAFTNVGGQDHNYIAALDPTTGAATAWDPSANNLGFVWSLAINNSTVYAGGWFNNIGGQPRNRIAALDRSSALATSWDPNANDTVLALTVNGSMVYAGGSFSSIGGQTRNHIAALDATTGLATDWNPNADNEISALLVNDSTVFAAGVFSNIGGQPRRNIAAIDLETGLAKNWNADTNYRVLSLAASGTTLYAGGYFTTIGGQERNRLAAMDIATGEVAPWDPDVEAPFLFPDVAALAVNGRSIYAGGNFASVGNAPHSDVAAVDLLNSVPLSGAVSRKVHGSAGTFDVDLTNGSGIECRSGGANGDYTLVFSFANPLSSVAGATVASGVGSAVSANIDTNDAHNCIVNLTNVANAQTLTIRLNNVIDLTGNFSATVSTQMGVLVGDTNSDGFVDSADIAQTKSQSGNAANDFNLREDLNADGFVDSTDIALVKSESGSTLPTSVANTPAASDNHSNSSTKSTAPRPTASSRN